jgi:(2R)-ethylmalonyl-CoA mutase
MQRLRAAGLGRTPVVVGGIVPPEDVLVLKQLGVAKVYTPKNFDLNLIMDDLVNLLETRAREAAATETESR